MKTRLLFTIAAILAVTITTNGQNVFGGKERLFTKDNQIPSYIDFTVSKDNSRLNRSSTRNQDALRDILMLNNNTSAILSDTISDRAGGFHESYKEYYKGIEVEGCKCTIHYDKSGLATTITGNFITIPEMSIVPSISEQNALQHALDYTDAKKYAWEDDNTELLIKEIRQNPDATNYPKGDIVFHKKNEKSYLTYRFYLFSVIPYAHRVVYIDAQTGNVIESYNAECNISATVNTRYSGTRSIETSLLNNQYVLRDYTRGNGIVTLDANQNDYVSTDNTWSGFSDTDRAAFDVHWGIEKTYDYYYNTFGRSISGPYGFPVFSKVNIPDYHDAAWIPLGFMQYGTDLSGAFPLVSLDITSHELTHAVTQSTSNLGSIGEGGALNEGMSDVFAVCVENQVKPMNGYKIWQMGEEIQVLRDLRNPTCKYYHGTGWEDTSNLNNDNGGIHTNSGVFGYWFYILTTGCQGNNQDMPVSGIGLDNAIQICYLMNSSYLFPDATYDDARLCSYLAATALGYDATVLSQICKAWYNVGVEPYALSISGPTIPCGPSVYFIDQLPEGCSVSWSWGATPPVPLVNNSPSVNKCTINNSNHEIINENLYATVSRGDTVLIVLEKKINTGANFSGTYSVSAQQFPNFYYPGELNHPFGNGSNLFLYKGTTVILTSSKFNGATITRTGNMPYQWSHNGNTITFKFRYLQPNLYLPNYIGNTEHMTVMGYNNNCETFTFYVTAIEPSDFEPLESAMEVSQSGNSLIVSFAPELIRANDEEKSTMPASSTEQQITITNALTGQKVVESRFTGSSLVIDTNGWKNGMYVVSANIGDMVLTKKFILKRDN